MYVFTKTGKETNLNNSIPQLLYDTHTAMVFRVAESWADVAKVMDNSIQ